jgi:formylglycine-generating enzyme required for sulfatase activity
MTKLSLISPARRSGRNARQVAAGALGLAGLLGVILYITTENGTVKITGTDPAMRVLVDGQEVRIENLGNPITIRTGPHKLLVTRDDMEAKTDTFLIRRGEQKVLEVSYNPKAPGADSTPARGSSAPEYVTTRVAQIQLKRIPAGTFLMGSPADDKDAQENEKPQHRVRITRSFYLGVYEVTQAQYETVTGYNPSWFSANGGGRNKVTGQSTDRYPVERVSWLDAVKFCNKLGEMEREAAFYEINGENVRVPDWNRPGYRLPTEAEWEYACRANAPTVTRYSFGDAAASLGRFAWYGANSDAIAHRLGEKRPNGFGLFDMHGNVREWCWDGYGESYYKESSADDPMGLDGASAAVFRGGGWSSVPRFARAADRDWEEPGYRYGFLGFRLAQVQSGR